MLDEYVIGNVDRISPEAPIPVLDVKDVKFVPGGAANTANNIKALGDRVFIAGVIGADEKGQLLKQLLKERGINVEGLVVDSRRKTTLKTRAMAKDQQIVRIDIENKNPIDPDTENKLLDFIRAKITEVNAVVISDYAKGVVTPSLSKKIISLCQQNSVISLVDPKGADYSKYRGCYIITPNKKELAEALNLSLSQIESEPKFLQAGKMLLSHVMSNCVLVTQGAEGMTLFKGNSEVFHYSAINKNAIDVSGAGDTNIGTFSLALGAGADPKDAAVLASHACGIVVGKVGTAVVYPQELEKSLKSHFDDENK